MNSLLLEQPHDTNRAVWSYPIDAYLDPSGALHACSHCRRMRDMMKGFHWDWVPALVNQREHPVQYGLCPACAAQYFAGQHSNCAAPAACVQANL